MKTSVPTSTPPSVSCSPTCVLPRRLALSSLYRELNLTKLTQRDNRRKTYYLKEQKLAKAYIGALALSKDSDAAHALAHWKVPTKEEVRQSPPISLRR